MVRRVSSETVLNVSRFTLVKICEHAVPPSCWVCHEFAIPIVYASHLQQELETLCEDVRCMERGTLV
jgi:hypothetical protein